MGKNVLILSDNEPLVDRFRKLIGGESHAGHSFEFAFSEKNGALAEKHAGSADFFPLHVKRQWAEIVERYDLVISLHCKQIFPPALVRGVRCINVHPGLNPHNRGWFPQVFSILNGLPCGATIHEIDEELDHGGIIAQKEVRIEAWDTSLTAYNKILDAEMELIEAHLPAILAGSCELERPASEGNLNLKKDFDALCQLDLESVGTFRSHIDKLRALTHGDYANAFFLDEHGRKVFVKIELRPAP